MTIARIGATGMVGSLDLPESLVRGRELTAIEHAKHPRQRFSMGY